MESRRIVYYSGNTIKRSWSKQSVNKRLALGRGKRMTEKYIIPKNPKVFATKNCMWCTANFEDFRIVCTTCQSCQYCGLVNPDSNFCSHCSNQAPPELMVERRPTRIRVF